MDLEKIKKEIEELSKNKFEIFYCSTASHSEYPCFVWEGDAKSFIKFAEKQNVKILYLLILRIGEENEEFQEQKGEIAVIRLSFLINNILHIFEETADWFNPREEEEETEEVVSEDIIKKNKDDLATEALKYLRENYEDSLNNYNVVSTAMRSFWLDKGIANRYSLDPKLSIKTQQVEEIVQRKRNFA